MSRNNQEWFLDSTLRPTAWDDYIGQKNIKENLNGKDSIVCDRR